MTGGEDDRLAPVIPLFGGPTPGRPASRRPRPKPLPEPDDDPAVEAAAKAIAAIFDRSAAPDDEGATDDAAGQDAARTGAQTAEAGAGIGNAPWHPTWAADRRSHEGDDDSRSSDVDQAEKALLKKLRTRSLSVTEARAVLREHDLDASATERVLASMEQYGYLDDGALAEQLIHAGVERKGQGRQVIAQTLAKRGIPRDVADVALASLPDDDFERALEFARGKARSLQSLDRNTALRRLTGQLARRGYGGSIAMTAARAALDEGPAGSTGVRFR